jgi:subtilisin-like proprotein convertase family protein
MRRTILLLLVLSLTPFTAMAAPEPADGHWHPLAGDGPILQAVETAESGIDLRLAVPGVRLRTTATRVGPRGVVEIPGAGATGRIGSPALPVLRYIVEVPAGAKVSVTLDARRVMTLNLSDLGIEAPLLPVQPPVPKIPGAEKTVPWVEDARTYVTRGPSQLAVVTDRAVVRGRHVVLVEVRPVRYDPVEGAIEVWAGAVLRVRFEGGDAVASRREKNRLGSYTLDRWLDDAVVGSNEVGSDGGSQVILGPAGGPAEGAEGMLVVVHDAFLDALQPFLDWKRKTGFKVEVVRTSDLGTSPTDADVKAAIQQRYDTWADPSLGFVLMVGDTDFTPIHLGSGGGNSQVTDNWYACLDGPDYLPDLAIARISTRSAAETTDVVDKLLTYERATFPTTAWAKLAGFIGTADSGHIGLIEGTHDDCIDTYYTPNGYQPTSWSHGYASCDRHYNTYDADTSEIAASIDEGRAIVNYSGHGGYTSWEGPTYSGSYDQADVLANTNDGMYPFVISNACITGTLDRDECFGETWQKAPNKGAIAFWGASNNSYWDEDDVLQRDLHDNIFPMDDTPPIGVIVNETKIDLYNHYGDTGTVAYYFDMYNLLSEPSLSIWTRAPRAWDVSHPAATPIGESSFTVSVTYQGVPVEGALVAVRKTDEAVFESGYTDAAGEVTLSLDPAPENVGPMEVTVTGHDFLPYEETSEVISPDSPWLVHRSHVVDDASGGDGDGHANPGETLVLPVTVENVGGQPGTGLAATLATTTPAYCQVLDADATFPDLASGEQGTTLPDHYQVRVDAAAADGVLLGFDLHWTASDGSSGTTSFGEMVEAVDFALDSFLVDDTEQGNGNGVAGPGETVDMTVTIANVGHRPASGIAGVLSTDSPDVTVLHDTADYPDLGAGQTGESLPPPYRFSVAEDAPDQQPVTFSLDLSETGSGYGESILFDVMISSCATTPSTDVPKPIDDNSTAESILDLGNAIDIAEVNVFVDIDHTYQGDLRLTLVSPSGTTCLLHDRSGGSTDDIVTWYDTETAPVESLDVFVGESSFGLWKLVVEDQAGGDTGALNDWQLEICGDAIAPVPTLAVAGHTVDDAGECDPDGSADVGETAAFHVTVRNTGWGDATGVRASLSSSATVAVLNNPVALPDLGIGEEAVAVFDVLVGAVGCLESATFDVDLTAAQGSWVDAFVETLERDVLDTVEAEDVEHGGAEPAGWSHYADQGVDDWRVVGDRNHTVPGAWSWFASDVSTVKDDLLVSPPYVLAGTSTVTFWHWTDLESGYDGGVLEISADGGATWTDLGPWITEGAYDRSMSGSNPIAGRDAWTGTFEEWRRVVADLTPWAGQTVVLRWRLTCDGSVSRTGWWVDDVTVETHEELCDAQPCGVPGEVTLASVWKDGADVVLEWWDDPVCTEFVVWRSPDPTSGGSFVDVTGEDPDPTDTTFRDSSVGDVAYWIVQGRGPDGDGAWGHYGL